MKLINSQPQLALRGFRDASTSPQLTLNSTSPRSTDRPIWMIVDDDENIQFLLQVMLERLCNAEIHCYSSAADALRAFETAPDQVHCVITDLDMPGGNGTELCRKLHTMSPQLTVVLSTGNFAAMNEVEARQRGFSGVIWKPFHLPEVQQTLASTGVLQRASADRDARRNPAVPGGLSSFTAN